MNLTLYKDFRFVRGMFISEVSEKSYKISIPKGDRFYSYMKKHFINEKVEGLTKEMIDEIIIEDPDKTFFDEATFTLNTDMLAALGNTVYAFGITIKRLKLNEINVSRKAYQDGKWILTLFELEIPYQTDIDIKELKD